MPKITDLDIFDTLVIGGGPAGLTAAIYLSRFHLSALIADDGRSRASLIPLTRNHAGFPNGVAGTELLRRIRNQAMLYGARHQALEIVSLTRQGALWVANGTIRARTVLLATGVVNRGPPMDEALHAERVLKAGARGYLMKGAELEGVVQALDAVQRGEIVLSPRMNTRILVRRLHGEPAERYADLSNREMQIFLLIGVGMTTGQIANDLNLSPKTVGAHREKIKTKLGLETASELEREALLYVERGH